MKIFLTGADGFVGKHVATACVKMGIEVVGVDISSGFDVRSKEARKEVPKNVDAIVHLAGLSNDPMCRDNGYECFETNVLGTLNIMEAAKERGAKQLIFASTEWVYDNCTAEEQKTEESLINIQNIDSEYALSKLVSESNLRQQYLHGFCPTTILRFGIICGTTGAKKSAVEALFMSVKENDEVTVGSLQSGRCFVHVSDIAEGIVKSIGTPGFEIVNLAGDTLITLEDIINTSKEVLGKNPTVKESDPSAVSVRNISNTKAKELLNWSPSITVDTWLKELAEHEN